MMKTRSNLFRPSFLLSNPRGPIAICKWRNTLHGNIKVHLWRHSSLRHNQVKVFEAPSKGILALLNLRSFPTTISMLVDLFLPANISLIGLCPKAIDRVENKKVVPESLLGALPEVQQSCGVTMAYGLPTMIVDCQQRRSRSERKQSRED